MFKRGYLKKSYQRLVGYIALTAVLFAALAPTLAHAFPVKPDSQALWQEICSAQGTRQIPVTLDLQTAPKQQDQNKMAGHLEHCPYCFTHAGSVGLLPVHSIVFSVSPATSISISYDQSPVFVQQYLVSPPSHAPPSFA
ncbi:MAG: DUF2946 domain-containing protein [Candidatus Methylopumilus sp.]